MACLIGGIVNKKETKAGNLLKQRRLANQLDQITLAKRAKTSTSQISRIERGLVSPSIATLEKIFAAMDEELHLSTNKKNQAIKKPQPQGSSILFP